jgi:hypothetical protein
VLIVEGFDEVSKEFGVLNIGPQPLQVQTINKIKYEIIKSKKKNVETRKFEKKKN